MILKTFINSIFDTEDLVYIGNDYRVSRKSNLIQANAAIQSAPHLLPSFDGCFITFNPMDSLGDIKEYRCFLIEIDNGLTVEKQMDFFRRVNLPFTTAVFTGGKSVHILIRLTKPLVDKEIYKRVGKALFHGLNCVIDPSVDPSKTTKLPIGKRISAKGITDQYLIEQRDFVEFETLYKWLSIRGVLHHTKPRIPKGNRDFELSNAKVIGYALAFSNQETGQSYVECPACGSARKLSVNLDEGVFRCFKECHWKDVLDAIDEEYGADIDLGLIKEQRSQRKRHGENFGTLDFLEYH